MLFALEFCSFECLSKTQMLFKISRGLLNRITIKTNYYDSVSSIYL